MLTYFRLYENLILDTIVSKPDAVKNVSPKDKQPPQDVEELEMQVLCCYSFYNFFIFDFNIFDNVIKKMSNIHDYFKFKYELFFAQGNPILLSFINKASFSSRKTSTFGLLAQDNVESMKTEGSEDIQDTESKPDNTSVEMEVCVVYPYLCTFSYYNL